ncbi:MFS transporter [Kitasatospora sp. LaBMicrA B282]|uniref:MFS transporter n=1 Tax=Kitasatospora sp. LaBMicrA B282 TaxID=3420949 RepID=UPI003D0F9A07
MTIIQTTATCPAPARTRRRDGLGRDFGQLLSAYAIQTLGEGALLTALPLLAGRMTSDPRLISWVGMCAELPWLLLALPLGVLVDRYDRRKLMIGTQAAQAGLLLLAAVLTSLGLTRIWVLYLLAFGLGTGDIVFLGASRAIVPALVRNDQLEAANSRTTTAETLGRSFLGPPLGSALFAFLLPLPFWLDAATYLVSLVLLTRIRGRATFTARRPTPTPTPAPTTAPATTAAPTTTATAPATAVPVGTPGAPVRRRLLAEATEGLRWLARHRVLRLVVLLAAVGNFTVFMAQSVLVVFADRVLHVGGRGYGLLLAAMALGGVLGALVSRRVAERVEPRTTALVIRLAGGAAMLAIGLIGRQVWVVVALFGAWSAGLSVWNVTAASLSQRLVPDELRGRVVSASRMVCFGALPLGALTGGLVSSWFGPTAPWTVGGGIGLLVGLAVLPELRRWPPRAELLGPTAGPSARR